MSQVKIVPYNDQWPHLFEMEAAVIRQALGNELVDIYHVGSTSVPGLVSKPKIDILAVVKIPKQAIPALESIGFAYRGEYNIPLHFGFSKRGDIAINLHVYEPNNPEIELNLAFRDYLRTHSEAMLEYAALKEELVKIKSSHEKQGRMFRGYNLGKDAFIRKVLKATGFNRLRMMRCTHYNEWEAAKKLAKKEIVEEAGASHLILYRGVDVIGYARVNGGVEIFIEEEKPEVFQDFIDAWLRKRV